MLRASLRGLGHGKSTSRETYLHGQLSSRSGWQVSEKFSLFTVRIVVVMGIVTEDHCLRSYRGCGIPVGNPGMIRIAGPG
jgi:hypothetical protein